MLLRGGRLGDISSDVLSFISSREADLWITKADLLVDRAHLVMLKEADLITAEDCSKIIAALDEIEPSDLPEGEDVHEAIEASVIAKAGEVGGRMHTGRSRNDEVATCIRLELREQMQGLCNELQILTNVLLCLSEENMFTIVPGFTHLQHAQPTTLGHHLLSHADSLIRDHERLIDAYKRVNICPLGAAAFASTGFPINRERTASLLGFDGLVENSMDAVSSRDFLLEVTSNLSILMVNLSRMAEEIILWSTSEFGYVEIDDMFASTSSIMPQKKNPDTAELVRGKTGTVIGCLTAVLCINKALPMSYNRDLQEATPHLWRAVQTTRSAVRIMTGCAQSLKFNKDRLKQSAGFGFSTATEIADSLVRVTKIPFRTAHRIVGRLSAVNQSPTLFELDDVAMDVAGIMPSKMGYTTDDLMRALTPEQNVAVRSRTGGPAPKEVERMLMIRKEKLERMKQDLEKRTGKTADAIRSLMEMK
jgi:argininosuccinate lyase